MPRRRRDRQAERAVRIRALLEEIERLRRSRVLVFAASHLETELLPPLYDALRAIGHVERLDILFYCHGGAVTAARAIALLLHQFTDHLGFIVPDRCSSSGTIAALAAHELVAAPAALFSPVDPLLQGSPAGGEGPNAVSAQDVRLFGDMSRDWFGLDEGEARSKALSLLCESVFPTTLTAFYRSTLEVEAVCLELLSLHMADGFEETKRKIVDRLLYGHHSHGFALMRADLADLGLPVRGDPPVEDAAWEVARMLRGSIGGAARSAVEDGWIDALLATRTEARQRRRGPDGLAGIWDLGEVE
jgi:hypothetical protein